MSKFITEKQTETYLQSEVRHLKMPDGQTKPVQAINQMWTIFDLLIEANMFSAKRLIEIAHDVAESENVTFDKALEGVCAYAHSQACKI